MLILLQKCITNSPPTVVADDADDDAVDADNADAGPKRIRPNVRMLLPCHKCITRTHNANSSPLSLFFFLLCKSFSAHLT